MRLGGWHRLWIVVCSLLLLVAAGFGALLWPEVDDIRHQESFYEALSDGARSQLAAQDGEAGQRVRMPNDHVIRLRDRVDARKSTVVLREYNDLLTGKLRQRKGVVLATTLGVWAAACGLVYLVGAAVGWLYRGFQNEQS